MDRGRRSFPTAAGWCFARIKRSSSRPSAARAGTHNQRWWLWVPATGSPRRERRGVPLAGTTATAGRACGPIHFSNSPSRSRGAFSAPGVLQLCFAHPNRGVGGAPRDVRVLARHPWGLHITRQARRLRGALRPIARQAALERAYDAGRSPLGAPPWRFWAPGPRFSHRHLPSRELRRHRIGYSELLAPRS